MIDIAFRDLRLHRLEAGMDLDNRASRAVARALGMRYEGVRRDFIWHRRSRRWIALRVFAATPSTIGLRARAPRIGTKPEWLRPSARKSAKTGLRAG